MLKRLSTTGRILLALIPILAFTIALILMLRSLRTSASGSESIMTPDSTLSSTPDEATSTQADASATASNTATQLPVSPSATFSVSALPTITQQNLQATLTPSVVALPCTGDPAVPQLTVWDDHSLNSNRLGFLNPGDTFPVYDAYYGPGGPLDYFYHIGYQGIMAWTPALYVTLSGDCSFLPPIPGLATSAPNITPSPSPTESESSSTPVILQFSVSGMIGTVTNLPASGGTQSQSETHDLYITITDIPPGDSNDSRRVVDYTLICAGGANDNLLVWGWAVAPGTFHCGDSAHSNGLKWDSNVVHFVVNVPAYTAYSLTIAVSAYP